MTIRPYTGLKDSVHAQPRAGTKAFVDYCKFLFDVKSLGIFSDRNINGSGMPNPPKSVHSTWRAFDLGAKSNARYKLIEFLYTHRDILGVEEIHDYSNTFKPSKFGWGAVTAVIVTLGRSTRRTLLAAKMVNGSTLK